MARQNFGGSLADFAIQPPSGSSNVVKSQPNIATGTFWSASTGGTQYTDLLISGVASTVVKSDLNGFVTAFQGPDNVAEGWVDFGSGTRFYLRANDGFPPKSFLGMTLPSVLNDYTALQAAAVVAAAEGKRLVAAGTITTSSTLTIKSDCDLSQVTINYSGTGTAVVLGDTAAALLLRGAELPKVVATAKSGTGWASVAGSVGVQIVNLNACKDVQIPHVQDFETGVLVYGQGTGVAYCNLVLGNLQNNKVNLKLDHDTTGWVNQNTFTGGRLWHVSGEGSNVSGVRHLLIVNTATNLINNNLFLGSSLEGNCPEFHADIAGTYNMIVSARWEATTPKVRWQDNSVRNQILYGYNSHNIVETFGTGTSANLRHDGQTVRYTNSGSVTVPTVLLENSGGTSAPADVVMGAGALVAGTAIDTGYAVQRSQLYTKMKATTDAWPRTYIQHNVGRYYFGSGAADPSTFMGPFGTSGISVSGILNAQTDNTFDLGSASNRWRDIYASRAFRVPAFATGSRPSASTVGAGGHVYDTTLSKPIWSDGTTWRDATGTAV